MPSLSNLPLWLRSGEQPEFLNNYLDAKGDFFADQNPGIAYSCLGAEQGATDACIITQDSRVNHNPRTNELFRPQKSMPRPLQDQVDLVFFPARQQ